jgi:hypothetical protein
MDATCGLSIIYEALFFIFIASSKNIYLYSAELSAVLSMSSNLNS